MSKIILTAEADLKDNELREWFSIMQRQLDRVNQIAVRHTKDIQELRRMIKEISTSTVNTKEKEE
jgi:hypothetical protein